MCISLTLSSERRSLNKILYFVWYTYNRCFNKIQLFEYICVKYVNFISITSYIVLNYFLRTFLKNDIIINISFVK